MPRKTYRAASSAQDRHAVSNVEHDQRGAYDEGAYAGCAAVLPTPPTNFLQQPRDAIRRERCRAKSDKGKEDLQ